MKTLLKALVILAILGAIIAGGLGYWGWQHYKGTPLSIKTLPAEFKVDKGASPRSLALTLQAAGVDVSGLELSLAMRFRNDANKLKPGVYRLTAQPTLEKLLNKIVAGDVIQNEVRLIEGWTFKQFRAALAQRKDLKQETSAMSAEQLLNAVGATETKPEGLFFPDTYRFTPGASDLEILKRAYKEQQNRLNQLWKDRDASGPFKTPYEALILASIVEKETGREIDRDKVAAVFVNRLKIGMMLQSDPTTIYGMGDRFDGNIRKRDLLADTAYNTYTRGGLTPTPISMPGMASIRAVLHPAQIAALYFVARGDGTSEFSNDLPAHNRAVDRYQRRRQNAPTATE